MNKQMVVETMMREKLSYREAARQFEIRDHNRVASWERIYLSMLRLCLQTTVTILRCISLNFPMMEIGLSYVQNLMLRFMNT